MRTELCLEDAAAHPMTLLRPPSHTQRPSPARTVMIPLVLLRGETLPQGRSRRQGRGRPVTNQMTTTTNTRSLRPQEDLWTSESLSKLHQAVPNDVILAVENLFVNSESSPSRSVAMSSAATMISYETFCPQPSRGQARFICCQGVSHI